MSSVITCFFSNGILGVNAEKQQSFSREGWERKTHDTSCFLKNIYLQMNGSFVIVLFPTYKYHVQCESNGDRRESTGFISIVFP